VLADIGVALYGEQWKAPLADVLGLHRDHLRNWLRGGEWKCGLITLPSIRR
jgi:hypothetical protein